MKDDNEKFNVLFKLFCMWKVDHHNKDVPATEKLLRQLQKTFEGDNVLEFPEPSSNEICRSRNFAKLYANKFIKSSYECEESDGDEWKKE